MRGKHYFYHPKFFEMEFLKILNVKELNDGLSTGGTWIAGSGGIIESHSPVDGKLIARMLFADEDSDIVAKTGV